MIYLEAFGLPRHRRTKCTYGFCLHGSPTCVEKSKGLSVIRGAFMLPSATVLQLKGDKEDNTKRETEEEGSSLSLPFLPLTSVSWLHWCLLPTQSLCFSLITAWWLPMKWFLFLFVPQALSLTHIWSILVLSSLNGNKSLLLSLLMHSLSSLSVYSSLVLGP